MEQQGKTLYIFLDEGGNFDFSPKGTKYFILTALTKERPFNAFAELVNLKYDLVEQGIGIEYFHATEDRQAVRNSVFGVIRKHISGVQIDSVIAEKAKTHPTLRPPEKLYPKLLGYLIRYILGRHDLPSYKEVLIFTDRIPVAQKKDSIAKAVKLILAEMLPKAVRYRIFHHASMSNLDLQVVDYCNWAIYKKWTNEDCRSYNLIGEAMHSEFDIFWTGTQRYY